jgi:hypothetical protein
MCVLCIACLTVLLQLPKAQFAPLIPASSGVDHQDVDPICPADPRIIWCRSSRSTSVLHGSPPVAFVYISCGGGVGAPAMPQVTQHRPLPATAAAAAAQASTMQAVLCVKRSDMHSSCSAAPTCYSASSEEELPVAYICGWSACHMC